MGFFSVFAASPFGKDHAKPLFRWAFWDPEAKLQNPGLFLFPLSKHGTIDRTIPAGNSWCFHFPGDLVSQNPGNQLHGKLENQRVSSKLFVPIKKDKKGDLFEFIHIFDKTKGQRLPNPRFFGSCSWTRSGQEAGSSGASAYSPRFRICRYVLWLVTRS